MQTSQTLTSQTMRLTQLLRVCTAALALGLPAVLPRAAHAVDVTPPPVPDNIKVPAGNTAFLEGHAVGTQDYICQPSGASFAWTFVKPQATLFADADDKVQIITHFLSPNLSPISPEISGTPRATWQDSQDTSRVWALATPATTSSDPAFVAPDAIPWLLLHRVGSQAGPTGGTTLTATTFIQRLTTTGGVAPATGCAESADVGKKALVAYTANYFFYKANSNSGTF